MSRQWICILATLLFHNRLTVEAAIQQKSKEGQKVEIQCRPSESGSMVMWFRVSDKYNIDFLASFSNNGVLKFEKSSFSSIFKRKPNEDVISLNSFNKDRDSGLYICASLKNSELVFGDVTRLTGEIVEAPAAPTLKPNPSMSVSPYASVPATTTMQGDSMFCDSIILIPLLGSCALLLLVIIIIIVYCNRIRTRRCPHHYKKRLQKKTTPGKQ
ncbi:T-cell surface glycoprotein CD8 alpha chain [Syngnathus scovelli]|uniref:T-cell surface glycoprotein CD8 alpha chain n=1 Tax=Syngnathus scovelli TaxID=161590 RepID=UPI0021105859|nr:T-cell surface glycoprotein CD8 alpha chain [Syngnathus scovelli]